MCEKGNDPKKEKKMFTDAELDRIAEEPLTEKEKDFMDGYAPVDNPGWLMKRIEERQAKAAKAAEAKLKKKGA